VRRAPFFVALFLCAIANAACDIDVTPPVSLQKFYPPGPIRREEKGAVVLEITVEFGRTHPVDVKIITGSGYPDLDAAAVKIAKAFDIRTECLTGAVRRTVHFDKDPNPAMHYDYAVPAETYIWVED
jgi:TonB family protein